MHGRVAPRDVLGQRQCQRWRLARELACALQRQVHGVGMGHVASDGFEQGGLQRLRPVLIEQAQQRGADAAQVVAPLGGHLQQLGGRGGDLGQRVAAAVCARATLVLDQCLQVGRVLDHLTPIEAAGVTGQFGGALEDAHALLIGQHPQRASRVGVRHRIVVQVESQWATKGP